MWVLVGPQTYVEGGVGLPVPGFRPPSDSEVTLVTDVSLVRISSRSVGNPTQRAEFSSRLCRFVCRTEQ